MAYEKRECVDFQTDADAEYMNHIQDGIANAEVFASAEAAKAQAAAEAAASSIGASSSTATGTVSLENAERPINPTGESATTGENPQFQTISGDGRHLYVTNAKSKTISIYARVGVAGLVLLGTVAVAGEPKGIVVTPSGKFVYVADWSEKKVWQYERNRFTGELKALGTPSILVNGGVAKALHLCVTADEKNLYLVSEEAKAGKCVFQYEIKATGELTPLAPEAVATTELGFCNYITPSPDGKSVYVGYESGVRLFSREAATGILTNVGLQESSGATGAIIVSLDNESVYGAVGGAGKLDRYTRNTGTGVLTKLEPMAVEKASGVAISADGKTVLTCSSSLNSVFQFKREKAGGVYELTALSTPSLATDTKPVRVGCNPDGANVYVLCETSKTVKGFQRTLQVKVANVYTTGESPVLPAPASSGVSGELGVRAQEAGVGFTLTSTNPADTGTVRYAIFATGPEVAGAPESLTLAKLATFTKEEDWLYNLLPYRSDVWRWDATAATLHPRTVQQIEALKEGSLAKTGEPLANAIISALTRLTEYGPNNFAPTINLGKSTDPEHNYEDAFGDKAPKTHKPEGAPESNESSDKGVTNICAPTARSITHGGEVVSIHDLLNGPGYSARNEEGPDIPLTGTALVAGGSTTERGGPSSSRIDVNPLLTIRFPSLYQADKNWRNAIPHPLRITVRKKEATVAGSGMAPRTTTKYGEGIVAEPANGRLPAIWPAHDGEAAANASTNVDALPNGAWLRLNPAVFTEAHIEGLLCPNWVKAVLWALVKYGAFVVDVQGQPGVELCRVEGLFSYKYRGSTYATHWLQSHTDNKWVKEGTEEGHPTFKKWTMDITGGGELSAEIWSALQVLKPPPKPAGLPS